MKNVSFASSPYRPACFKLQIQFNALIFHFKSIFSEKAGVYFKCKKKMKKKIHFLIPILPKHIKILRLKQTLSWIPFYCPNRAETKKPTGDYIWLWLLSIKITASLSSPDQLQREILQVKLKDAESISKWPESQQGVGYSLKFLQ